MNTRPFRVPLVDFLGEQPWGARHGREAFSKLAAMVADRPDVLMCLDMKGVSKIDASCSREILANLVERHRSGKWFFLRNVANASVEENIDAAFARKDMSIVLRRTDDEYTVLGKAVGQHLVETLEVAERTGTTTSRAVCSAIKGLALTACNNRLKDLCDAGLLARIESAAESGGREFVYVALK